MSMTYEDINKLKDLMLVIFRDVHTVDDAWEFVDSELFNSALNAALDAWEWDSETGEVVLDEMRDARKRFEKEDTPHTVLLDVIIDKIKERRKNEQDKHTDARATEDGQEYFCFICRQSARCRQDIDAHHEAKGG